MDSFKYATTIILIVIAAVGGFLAGKQNQGGSVSLPKIQSQASQIQSNPLLKSQTATFQGTITKVSGQTIDVKSDSGQTGSFPVSARVVIYKFNGTSPQASASSDLKTIETGKQALVMLELLDNKYQVVSVSYLPPPPAPKK